MKKELCKMCLRRKVDCGIRKFRKRPWQDCRFFYEDKTEKERIMKEELKKAIIENAKLSASSQTAADDALKFSQACENLANALYALNNSGLL